MGERGRQGPREARAALRPAAPDEEALVRNLADAAESFASIETADLDPLMERIGSARIVLLGEATHGTSEFYRMRERITRELIVKKGFRFVAIEADWPDAARVDHYVRHFQYPPSEWTAFARFPTWMWRNAEVRDFVSWLRKHNGTVEKAARRVSRPRSLQPLRFDPGGAELSRRGRSRNRRRWRASAMAA